MSLSAFDVFRSKVKFITGLKSATIFQNMKEKEKSMIQNYQKKCFCKNMTYLKQFAEVLDFLFCVQYYCSEFILHSSLYLFILVPVLKADVQNNFWKLDYGQLTFY